MIIAYRPSGVNNFHSAPAINLRVSGETTDFNGPVYRISARQAARVARHFCGISDCHCPAGAVIQLDGDGTQFGLRTCYVDTL